MSRKKDLQPYWRPNVRVVETLPDIKVVRTNFIINFLAVSLVVITGVYLLQKEYRVFALNRSISNLQQQINTSNADNNKYLKLNQRFSEAANYVLELQSFYSAPFKPHQLIAELSGSKPDEMRFTKLSISESVISKNKVVSFNINIRCEVPDLTILNSFKSILSESTLLQPDGYTAVIVESFQAKDVQTGFFPCSVSVVIEPVKEKSTKSKK
ncbi:MAG: hypothetical protein AAGH40_12895 [Verrucomicrobiota bacterium]